MEDFAYDAYNQKLVDKSGHCFMIILLPKGDVYIVLIYF